MGKTIKTLIFKDFLCKLETGVNDNSHVKMNSFKTQRSAIGIWGSILILLLLMLSPAVASAAELEIRVGEHGDHSRIVFDWNRMVGYTLDRQGNRLTVTFNAGADAPFRVPSAHRMRQIEEIRVADQSRNRTVIEVDIAPHAQVRDFRLVRRIVFDISEGSPPPPDTTAAPDTSRTETVTPPAPTAPPPELTPAPATVTEEAAPEEDIPEEDPPEEDPPEDIAQEITEDIAEEAEAETETELPAPEVNTDPVVEETARPAEDETEDEAPRLQPDMAVPPVVDAAPPAGEATERRPTIITIALIQPTGLAVFDRFGYLWLVLESRRGTVAPERFGPLANILGPPEMMELEGGGLAYRFRYPAGQHISVRKEQMAWQIVLTETEQPSFSGAYIEPEEEDGEQSLVGHLNEISRIFTVTDPVVGDDLWIAPTRSTSQRFRNEMVTPDVEILDTYLGFAATPRRDDLQFDLGRDRITISAAGGLNLSEPALRRGRVDPFESGTPATAEMSEESRLFNFQSWRQGGIRSFSENRYTLINQLARIENENDRTSALFQLALLYFANGFGDEALGILDLVAEKDEKTAQRSSYLAIRGAAKALAGRYEDAIQDLGAPALQTHPEAQLWRGYAAAAAEQWRLAERLFPEDTRILDGYPEKLAIPLTLYMAESALRSADSARAATLLEALDVLGKELPLRHQAAQHYLRGEMYRQNNQPDKALEEWNEAIEYRDRLYQTKARLAKTLLEWQSDMITAEAALEKLEHMRFAWRDDGLETQILHSIGLLRVVNGRYHDGLAQLQNAIRLAKGQHEDTEPITNDMIRIFRELFVEGKARDLPKMEAITIFNGFQELMPTGAEGVTAVLTVSDLYVDMDLLDRASTGMEELLEDRAVQGEEASRVGARLAAVYLLNDKPNEAVSALQRTGRSELPADLQEERQLLRGRALSQLDMKEEAIEALSDLRSRNAQRLRADIYWRAADWEQAASAFSRLLPRADVDQITEEEAEYILNTAIALKLAGRENRLQAFKSEYNDLMQASTLAPSFNVVTREAGRTTLSDRETMLNIAEETDIFKGFLDSYRAGSAGVEPD